MGERLTGIDLNGAKILFVLPPFEKEHKITPPVGVGYLAAVLENNGAELFNQLVKSNNIDVTKIDWDKFDSYNSKISISNVSEKRLKKLWAIANREFYLRPRILFGFLKYIKQTKWIIKRLLHYL